ncbi:MAG: uridine kinase [Acidimicrobiales bacterium]
MSALVIGISGGSGSGKSRLATDLASAIGPERVSVLPFDSYYKDLRHLSLEARAEINFDHPESLDADLFASHLDGLAGGLDVCVPVYDFARHQRADDVTILPATEVVIAEGILLFAFTELLERFDMKVFRHAPADVRFERRLNRDVIERGRSPESVREQFELSVGPMHDAYVEPSAAHADRVVTHEEVLETVITELAATVGSRLGSTRV